MRDSTIQRQAGSTTSLAETSLRARLVATLVVSIAALCAIFLPEIRAAVEVWNASTAYSHCYLVLPMAIYLLWDRRAVIASVMPSAEPGWAVFAIPIALAWLASERLGIMEGRQLAAIAAFQLLFLVVLGRRLYWALSGALLYMFFLVPFGAFLTPALQRFTADFSIAGLNLLGIPNYSDTFTIETPAGVFFVAEACAGLRFLIAAVAFGVFYALLNYQSMTKRLLFMLASIVVPIIANGFRALGIVVLGQILGSAEAAAADHILYGWLFFSIVMLLLVAAGHAFRDTAPALPLPPGKLRASVRAPYWGAIAAVVLIGVGPAVAAIIDARSVELPLVAQPSFMMPAQCVQGDATDPSPTRLTLPISCNGIRLEMAVAVFPARSTASAMMIERRRVTQEIGAEDVSVAAVTTATADQGVWTLVQTTDPNRVTAVASWVDGAPVRSGFAGRIAQARDSLLGSAHAPVLITVTSAEPARSTVEQRREAMAAVQAVVGAQTGLNAQIDQISLLR